MKNREKYRDEILEALAELFKAEGNIRDCSFMKKHVIPNYDLKKRGKEGTCIGLTCIDCAKMFAFWLDEEAPPTDWVNVPVDTLVLVRDVEEDVMCGRCVISANGTGEWAVRDDETKIKNNPTCCHHCEYCRSVLKSGTECFIWCSIPETEVIRTTDKLSDCPLMEVYDDK